MQARPRAGALAFLFLTAAAGAAACASAPKPRQLGAYPTLSPHLAVVDSEVPPRNLTVGLSAPASVVVIYVAPGRATRIVYPADSAAAPRLSAGTHRLTATWPRARLAADSARRDSIVRANIPRTRRDSIAGANAQRIMALPDPEAGLAPVGYLMVFATPDSLPYGEVRRKVEGVTTPLDTDEALNAIAKQVTATLSPSAAWAGYAVEVVAAQEQLPANVQRR